MKKLLGVLVLCLLVTGAQTAFAEVEKNTLWRDAVVTVLDVDFTGTGFHARWQYHRCHCGDLLVQVEQIAPDGMLTGELLMVGGQVLLSRGFEEQGENITPLMQAPVLMLQLTDAILNRSEPRGPHAVSAKQKWDVEEDKLDFNLTPALPRVHSPRPGRLMVQVGGLNPAIAGLNLTSSSLYQSRTNLCKLLRSALPVTWISANRVFPIRNLRFWMVGEFNVSQWVKMNLN